MAKLIVLDTETAELMTKTKLTNEDAIELGYENLDNLPICFQLSYMVINDNDRKKIRDAIGKPPIPLNFEASEATGMHNNVLDRLTKKEDGSNIKIQDTSEFNELKEMINELEQNNEEFYIVGHNIKFDIDVMRREGLDLSNVKVIDTLQLSKRLDEGYEFNRLSYLLYRKEGVYDIVNNIISNQKIQDISKIKPLTSHNSLHDIFTTNTIFQEYKSLILDMEGVNNENIYQKMHELSVTPFEIKHIPYGFRKDTDINELNVGELFWYLKTEDIEMNFKYTIDKIVESWGGYHKVISDLSDYEINRLLTDNKNKEFVELINNVINGVDQEERIIKLGFGKHKNDNIQEIPRNYLEWVQSTTKDEVTKRVVFNELNRRDGLNKEINQDNALKSGSKVNVEKEETIEEINNSLDNFMNS